MNPAGTHSLPHTGTAAINRDELLGSESCGCFYCLRIFRPDKVEEWIDEIDGLG